MIHLDTMDLINGMDDAVLPLLFISTVITCYLAKKVIDYYFLGNSRLVDLRSHTESGIIEVKTDFEGE